MERDFEKQLEELIHRELRKLPDLPAPDTLISRVRSAIAAQDRQPWWQRPLLTWPLAMRLGFVALLLGALGAAGFYGAEISQGASVVFQNVEQIIASFTPLWERLSALANAVLILSRAISAHFLIYGAVLLGLMYLTCAGFGTLFYRLTFAKR
ncbi:MAG: hypothetical protein HY298_10725 [Verrucomicrobia bacterium]|nr:hypothetical protein [Verrucomicrobiota bacterium]